MPFSGKVYGKKRQKESFYFLADTKRKKELPKARALPRAAMRGGGRDGRTAVRGAGNSGEQLTAIFSDGGGMRGKPGSAAAIRPLSGRAKKGLRAGAAVAAAIPGDGSQEGGAAVRGERCRAKPWGLRPRGDCRDLQAVMKQAGGFVRACLSDGEQWRGPVVFPAEGAVMRGTFGGGCAAAGNAACRRRRAKLRFRHEEG